ncbi:MAG: TVP38/TMEM64 family protein [Gammaproteobacteria bacterium]|nr:TVP38/TMEM64 family protein [Gammaproteobacteria bacterium]MYF28243.1 TVP38/TMEM64 family protein [Gammaproteobacteria bacterium]MYK45681.1 TVP38/TMEM64 family protein [Gammaproteobacteria bacterium]
MKRNQIILLGAIIGLVALFFVFDLGRYLNLEYFQEQRSAVVDIYQQNTLLFIVAFMAIYIAMAALSLPGATIMTLAAGAVFGLAVGLVLVSFASTIGATLACLLARYLFRDAVQSRFGKYLGRINEGVEKDGAFYLFAMRLVPAIPFFAINLVMALTPIRLWTFYWVSQIGMLAGTAVYVNAGKEIGQLESLAGILSPTLVISFVLLGVFPFVAKKVLNLISKRFGKGEAG